MALAEEANVPEREETVEWIFLSEDKTDGSEEVCGKLKWYTMQCGIE
ncbi:MAG: hypothetical protein OZ917_06025 [Candidatus Brocadiaceae bacterium]|nr:hypothetical protein [Candidatus Brocadiaceae bacterium]